MALYARLWTDILDDPKLMRAARTGAKNLQLLPWFIAFAKRADAEGRIEIDGKPADPRDIARSIPNATARKVAKSLSELRAIGVLSQDPDSCYRFVAWDFRNSGKTSDSREAVAARVRLHRERKRREREAQRNGESNTSNALQSLHDVTDVTSKRVESREKRVKGESREKRDKRSSSSKVSLPPAAIEFGRTFYADAPLERQRDVRDQLAATLNGGAKLRKGIRIVAGSVERLEAACRAVIADAKKIRDRDSAIIVLLTKLGDVSKDSPTEKAAAAVKREEREDTARLAHAEAWLETVPDTKAELEDVITKGTAPGMMPSVAAILRNAAILKAWKDAGEPIVEPAGSSS